MHLTLAAQLPLCGFFNGPAAQASPAAASSGHDLAIEERLELVMSQIPLAEKLAFVNRWISGEC